MRLEVTIPPNTTATVFVPVAKSGEVTESGQPATNAKGVKFLRAEKAAAAYEVGSGSHVFEVPSHPLVRHGSEKIRIRRQNKGLFWDFCCEKMTMMHC